MNLLESLKHNIASVLSVTKAYELPAVCTRLGLEAGDDSEAWSSKYRYVLRRVQFLGKDEAIRVAKEILQIRSSYQLEETLDKLVPLRGTISAITRRQLIDTITELGPLEGRLEIGEFLNRIFPLSEMPYDGDYRCPTLQEGVYQHMILNPDWTYKEFFGLVESFTLSERRFRSILEEVVHPEVRTDNDQKRFVDAINPILLRDGFELAPAEQISGHPIYRIFKKGGVSGHFKNLIFAANGPKPQIILADAINNDIQIVRNQEFCLIYDRPIGLDGLSWSELVQWWAEAVSPNDPERSLYQRLAESLTSRPEKRLFRLYFEILRECYKDRLPAIIPQVYLHYDPYTIRHQPNGSSLVRQRMDFLLLLRHRQRVVIEIDGKQHYANGDVASPERYAAMVAEDRNLRLLGYEVYRFGGYELMQDNPREIVEPFLNRLMALGP
jgi:very-short-patch-repair endonuclease